MATLDYWREPMDETTARSILSPAHATWCLTQGSAYCAGRAQGAWQANLVDQYGAYRALERLAIAQLKDTEGQLLEVGAMYCCALHNTGPDAKSIPLDLGQLVRYAGDGRFLDADTLDETFPDWDVLVRQVAPVIPL
ncbi:hypothetical protein ISE1_2733 [plant metagenome]|uniref:Uncharacterized protein n=1 Tax=plant metagenome TaxID=1297885 RepID=A0A484UIQ7_9ZZZZ